MTPQVYQRISWTEIAMSRAETARCPRDQTATSWNVSGAHLYLQLTEMERLYDDCPQRYDPGVTPGRKQKTIFRLYDGKAVALGGQKTMTLVLALAVAFLQMIKLL